MRFTVGKSYEDRVMRVWQCIKPPFGTLPTFRNDLGKTIVQNINGRYRFDEIDSDRDMVKEWE